MGSKLRKSDRTYVNADDLAVKADAVANLGALTSTDAAGANPTKAEFDALRADVAAIHAKTNALLAELRQGNAIAT